MNMGNKEEVICSVSRTGNNEFIVECESILNCIFGVLALCERLRVEGVDEKTRAELIRLVQMTLGGEPKRSMCVPENKFKS